MHPGEKPFSKESSFLVPSLSLGETEFLQALYHEASRLGKLGPLFPGMVYYNVSGYLMKNLWPELYESRREQDGTILGYAANESGWQGKLNSLRSVLDTASGTARIDKNFVMEGPQFLALCRVTAPAHSDPATGEQKPQMSDHSTGSEATEPESAASRLAIVLLSSEDPGLHYSLRKDPESRFESEGRTFQHFRVQGEAKAVRFQIVSASRYRRFGPVFMMREITGLGAIAAGILNSAGQVPTDSLAYLERAGQNRANGRPTRQDLITARGFIHQLCESVTSHHPLWDRLDSAPE
ncbi:MAG: hypothetical protein CMN76_18070 [Spirochaetaceae bacterium]|nr:hypothetical protein [Spirochaetaceae bacterium]|tara:strand:+ start:184047 stop:184931 length:885 start_codon:yes stop_codon:yes gene_type:complete